MGDERHIKVVAVVSHKEVTRAQNLNHLRSYLGPIRTRGNILEANPMNRLSTWINSALWIDTLHKLATQGLFARVRVEAIKKGREFNNSMALLVVESGCFYIQTQ